VTEADVTVHMDVPGMPRANLEIELEDDVLTISRERPDPTRRRMAGARGGASSGFGCFERIEIGIGRSEEGQPHLEGASP
jgi:Hsp20/alpha crystallin family